MYHRKELGVVNCGALKELAKTPKHYRAWLSATEQHETPALLFGRALHALVLEPDLFAREWAQQPEFGDLRTKAGKERRDDWLSMHRGVTAVSADDWQRLQAMRDAVMAHPIAGKLFTGGVAESTAIWTDPEHGLLCKARMDYYVASRGLVIDLKSTEDASESAFARSVATYRYHVQHAHYASAFQSLGHELRAFLFVAVEKTAPFAVNVMCLDADAEARGMELRDRDMVTLNRCLQTDTWPGYEPTIHRLALPRWALND
ncbi:MAG: hypothetical protein ABS82_00340 [Rhodanobacter sp. SCN 67-45]|nr:MAG: hypothetical protein ABS82_00340 [Rhodanobacter sp. SCN 67-45]